MLVPQTNAGGVPHRLLEAILDIFVVLGGLGRFGQMLEPFCMAMEGLAEVLSDCWTASGGLLGGLGEVLGVMLGIKVASKFGSYQKKCCSKRQKVPKLFFYGFCVEDK